MLVVVAQGYVGPHIVPPIDIGLVSRAACYQAEKANVDERFHGVGVGEG